MGEFQSERDVTNAGKECPVNTPIAWTSEIAKFLLSDKVSDREKGALLRRIDTSLNFEEVRDLFAKPEADGFVFASLAEKVSGVRWKDCASVASSEIRRILFFGAGHYPLAQHKFLDELIERINSPDHSAETYSEAISALVGPIFTKIAHDLEGEVLHRYPQSEIERNATRLADKVESVLTPEEQHALSILKIDPKKNHLSLYLRHMNGITYGPLADALLICTSLYMQEKYSSVFDGVRIIPAKTRVLPNPNILALISNVETADVIKEDFRILIKLPAVYFSHSSFEGLAPSITSAATVGNSLSVRSRIELEDAYSSDYTRDANLEEIFGEYLRNLAKFDKNMTVFLNSE